MEHDLSTTGRSFGPISMRAACACGSHQREPDEARRRGPLSNTDQVLTSRDSKSWLNAEVGADGEVPAKPNNCTLL